MRLRWQAVSVVTLLTVGLWAAVAQADPPTYGVRVRFAQSKQDVFLSFQNSRMRMAKTRAALDSAPIINAKEASPQDAGQSHLQIYNFPETELPVKLPGFTKVAGTFTMYRSLSRGGLLGLGKAKEYASGHGNLIFSRRDAGGRQWGYAVSQSLFYTDHEAAGGRRQSYLISVAAPDLGKLTGDIEIKVEQRKVRIGLHVKAGKIDLDNVVCDGKGAPISLEVTDSAGHVVASEKGDLTKFGFT